MNDDDRRMLHVRRLTATDRALRVIAVILVALLLGFAVYVAVGLSRGLQRLW